jgi:alkylation response protein AidB-like acyl-CoA dehydrogenase
MDHLDPAPETPHAARTAALPDSRGVNAFDTDGSLRGLLPLYLPAELLAHLTPHFTRLGALVGDRLDDLAHAADHNPPVLHHRDRRGRDRQRVEKHPAYVAMEQIAFGDLGLAAMSHRAGVLDWPASLPPAAKYALTYLFVQSEFGLCCPVSMTDSLTRTLRKFGAPELVARYLPGLTAQDLDTLTQGAMFMTEQQAGSDVGGVATVARRDGDAWRLTGEKWFCSNADAGLAMVLARPEGAPAGTRGLGLFLLPRVLPDGTPNAYRIVRLKDKLGTRSMASGEITLGDSRGGALAYAVGDIARGFAQMTDMINMSRLSNGVRAAGLMRRALREAVFVAGARQAFGKRVIDLPLMRRQLLKIMLPTEQALSMVMVTAQTLAAADAGDDAAGTLLRILTPLLKFRACRDARAVTGDAMEVRGGCGYIEDWIEPRLLRDAHLGSIWEGTSNVVALDVMRAARRQDSHRMLARSLGARLDAARVPDALRARLDAALARTLVLFDAALADPAAERLARQAASALYHVASAAVMAVEAMAQAARGDDARRLVLARLVLDHRLTKRDPLAPDDLTHAAAVEDALLSDTPLPLDQACALVR